MKRLSLILAAAVALCAVMAAFAGCGAPALDPEGSHTVTDHAGNAVEVPNTIDRIVVLDIYPVPAALSVVATLSHDMPPEALAYAALADRELWGEDLRSIDGLEARVALDIANIQRNPKYLPEA